jgi:hypothetical protein
LSRSRSHHRLQVIRDPTKDKPLEIEMGWLHEGTQWNFSHVPKDLVAAADVLALETVGLSVEPAVVVTQMEAVTMDVSE